MKIINRPLYLDSIRPFIGKHLIKVFTGQRRVGKSYIMRQLMKLIQAESPKNNIIFIDKEKFEFDSIRDYRDLYQYVKSHYTADSMNYVFIDEVQEIQDFEKALRDLNEHPGFDIYCTGSNSEILSSELSTFLSGRFIEKRIHSLSFIEFLNFHGLEKSSESFLKYIKFGGMPYLIHLDLEEYIVNDYLKNIYNSILLKDVVRRHNIRNVNFLDKLILFVSDNLGSIVSVKRISDFLKSQKISLSVNTVNNYLDFLVHSYFIDKVQRYDITGKKYFELYEKYYFEDIGLRNHLVGYRQSDMNKIMENLVYNHLIASGYDVSIGVLGSQEIDFVGSKQGNIVYIQVAYMLHDQSTINREFGNLLKINDNYRKMVVSMDPFSEGNIQGVEHIQLMDFLTQPI